MQWPPGPSPHPPQVLVFFLVLSFLFNLIMGRIRDHLRRTNRRGFLAAVEKMTEELTTLGLISLILLSIQRYISNICGVEDIGLVFFWKRGCSSRMVGVLINRPVPRLIRPIRLLEQLP